MSAADTFLPLIVADAMRPDLTPEEEEKAEKEGKVRMCSPGIYTVHCFHWSAPVMLLLAAAHDIEIQFLFGGDPPGWCVIFCARTHTALTQPSMRIAIYAYWTDLSRHWLQLLLPTLRWISPPTLLWLKARNAWLVQSSPPSVLQTCNVLYHVYRAQGWII